MKTRQIKSFDFIAPFYDPLTRLIFGKTIIHSQMAFLHLIPENAKVLIIGGGSGQIIEKVFFAQPKCEIYYVETSRKMIDYARKKAIGHSVNFIHGKLEEMENEVYFDVVITHFFLDIFTEKTIRDLTPRINSQLKSKAIWLITDFVESNIVWQKLLLSFMYAFFYSLGNTETQKLSNWENIIEENEFVKTGSKFFCKKFIKSVIYMKS